MGSEMCIRDRKKTFNIAHDLDILSEVFGRSDGAYRRENYFWKCFAIKEQIDMLEPAYRDSLLKISDIGIAPSKYEGFGFPLVEMIATGLPVIVSDKASLPELAGNAGLIFNSSDSNDLKEKMKELIENAALRNKVAENSKLRRDDFFGWDEYAKKLEDLYKEIISGNI